MDKNKAEREGEYEQIKKEANTLSNTSCTSIGNIEICETIEISPIESVRRDVSSDCLSIDVCNQMVSSGGNQLSLLGLESNSLIQTDCHVNSQSNKERKSFLRCITSTPTATKRNESITDFDLSSILCGYNESDSELLFERPISRLQFTDEFVQTVDENLTSSYKFDQTIDERINDEINN